MEELELNDKSDDLVTSEGDQGLNIKNNILGLIRTTQRNYINLTNIADNKAQILISINSLMFTFLIPIFLANYDIILEKKLYYALSFYALTCLSAIILASKVLKPFNTKSKEGFSQNTNTRKSPFFFSNYDTMTLDEYTNLFKETLQKKEIVSQVIVNDLYFFGLNLSQKYKLVNHAYNAFYIGMILSFAVFIITLIFNFI